MRGRKRTTEEEGKKRKEGVGGKKTKSQLEMEGGGSEKDMR